MEHAIPAVLKRDVPALRLLIALNLLLAASASAAPTVIGIGAFSGSETVIDFETIGQNDQVINQFTPIGATFSGDLFGDTFNFNLGFFINTAPGNVIACNFINGTCDSPDDCNGSFTVDFSPPVIRVGFDTITAGFGTTVTLFRSGGQTGGFFFGTSVPDTFIGIEDLAGIDRVVVDAVGDEFGAAISINNFRYEGIGVDIDLDHFKCYEAVGVPVNVITTLEDQFGLQPLVLVGKPKFFCNPVDKNGEGIKDPTAHLTCYEIAVAEKIERVVVVANQFGEQQALEVENSKLLCVPSEKIVP